jgi:hypothetical protein
MASTILGFRELIKTFMTYEDLTIWEDALERGHEIVWLVLVSGTLTTYVDELRIRQTVVLGYCTSGL